MMLNKKDYEKNMDFVMINNIKEVYNTKDPN